MGRRSPEAVTPAFRGCLGALHSVSTSGVWSQSSKALLSPKMWFLHFQPLLLVNTFLSDAGSHQHGLSVQNPSSPVRATAEVRASRDCSEAQAAAGSAQRLHVPVPMQLLTLEALTALTVFCFVSDHVQAQDRLARLRTPLHFFTRDWLPI